MKLPNGVYGIKCEDKIIKNKIREKRRFVK